MNLKREKMETKKNVDNSHGNEILTESSARGNKKTPAFVGERNLKLLKFFKHHFPTSDVRIMGEENSPAVVIDHEFILSCYVHNFELRFTNKNFQGDIVLKFNLNEDFNKSDKQKINDWYKNSQHRKVNRIYLESEQTQAPLYLVGWNFKNKTKKEGKYPVFGEYEPKVYFKKEKALEVQNELIQMGYNVLVI